MKSILILLFSIVYASPAFSTTINPPPAIHLSRFIAGLEAAELQGRPIDIEKWSDIETQPIELQAKILGTYAQNQPNVSDYFVIIPRSERAKFPHGNLLVISASPFNLTAWERQWYEKHQNYTPEQLADFDKVNPKDEIIRWYLAEDKEGKYKRTSISEEELTQIVQKTGLRIPEPVKYRFNMAQLERVLMPVITLPPPSTTPYEVSSAETATSSTPKSTLITVTPPNKSSNPLWWIIGAIVALVAVALVVRRRKPRL